MSERTYRALLVGNSEFPDEPNDLPSLKGPDTDVHELHRALVDPQTGLHKPGSVETAVDETSQELRIRLARFFGQANVNEQLLLYYSGHGLLDSAGDLYLCTRDTQSVLLSATAVDRNYINKQMSECAAPAVVLLLDCCFSGAAVVKGTDIAAPFAGKGRYVLTSSGHYKASYDASGTGEASPFTQALVKGLESGAEAREGYATFQTLYDYLTGNFVDLPQPHMKAEAGAGQIPMARRPGAATAESSPDYLLADEGEDLTAADLVPLLTDGKNQTTRLPVCSSSSGTIYARLPDGETIFGTTRADIVRAGSGGTVAGQLYYRAEAVSTGESIEITPCEGFTEVEAAAESGAARFTLPSGQTLVWQRPQVDRFAAAQQPGGWPRILPWRRYGEDRWANRYDPALEGLSAAARKARGYAAAGAAAVVLAVVLNFFIVNTPPDAVPGWIEVLGYLNLLVAAPLAAILSLMNCVTETRKWWILRQVDQVRHDPKANVTPMVMVHWVKRARLHSMAGGVVESEEMWVSLWPKDEWGARHRPPRLSVRLLDSYADTHRHFLRDVASHSGAALTYGTYQQVVEVIGDPRPGQWLLLRTAKGKLWPGRPAQDATPWQMEHPHSGGTG